MTTGENKESKEQEVLGYWTYGGGTEVKKKGQERKAKIYKFLWAGSASYSPSRTMLSTSQPLYRYA